MMRVFLVEDEPPAMRKLERMAGEEPDLEVCGSASTVSEAIAGIARTHPDLVILDIRLPDGTGFEILQALDEISGQRSLQIVFLTAYDEYALEAFNVAALDYLLKPVSRERFSAAIERVRERLKTQPRASEQRYTRRFLVERRKAAYFLPVESIRHILADRNYALLHSDLGEFAIRATIEGLEKRLDPAEFARVSRSAIVRVAAIKEIRMSEDSNCVLVMQSGEEIACSRKYWTSALEKLL
jgi:two-component system, LytTR family, response regulator